jgi:hypothetical protein
MQEISKKKREEEGVDQCTFKPEINRESLNLLATSENVSKF